MKKFLSPLCGLFSMLSTQAQTPTAAPPTSRLSAEVNILWPIFPGNLYNGKVLYNLRPGTDRPSAMYLGFNVRPQEFREDEGDWSNWEALVGYRHYFTSRINFDAQAGFGQGTLKKSVVDGRDYQSFDVEVGAFLGYKLPLGGKRVKPYINLQPLGVLYVAYQSEKHPIVGQSSEKPIYAGAVQFGLRF
ncbi:hypothetical protein [Hymenobacter terrenus]|uniref:hypothetical protein n=1 Tax=Hymenobacter terrenus TaxID=1629124 RepID=UPI0006199578|nr:hypothetical protein [Hymenobacter terrenus]